MIKWIEKNPQWFVGGIALVLLCSYFYWFGIYSNGEISVNSADWGTLGDFFGGLLNPLVSLFALIWLKKSVDLQNRQIEEMRASAIEDKEIRGLETDALKVRAFEQTFYGLLDRFTMVSKDVSGDMSDVMKFYYKNNDVSFSVLPALFDEELDDTFRHYFVLLYRVLKFVDESYPLVDDDLSERKKYTGILRALIDKKATQLLAIYCGRNRPCFEKYRGLICNFSMLEHLSLKGNGEFFLPLVGAIYHYPSACFGNSHKTVNGAIFDRYTKDCKDSFDICEKFMMMYVLYKDNR
ncbi:MAG: hypothetical protein NT086_09585 [Proteobacteria bacterium]|nr:hypothetical protein [Pseudomonadota bacterium]